MRYFSALWARMYRFSANSRATILSPGILLAQQSRQYFSSPRGSETSLAPHSAHRALTTVLRDMPPIYNLQFPMSKATGSYGMDRPTHAGLRHVALNVTHLDDMKRFYVDL